MQSPARYALHVLLILLVLASGTLAAVQAAHHGDAHASNQPDTFDWHSHGHTHPDHHDVLPDMDTPEDEHGHHFHVHLPLQALLSAIPVLDWFRPPTQLLTTNQPPPLSLIQAPPVPPPNV
jgi:hypothetical protein